MTAIKPQKLRINTLFYVLCTKEKDRLFVLQQFALAQLMQPDFNNIERFVLRPRLLTPVIWELELEATLNGSNVNHFHFSLKWFWPFSSFYRCLCILQRLPLVFVVFLGGLRHDFARLHCPRLHLLVVCWCLV